MAGQQILKPNKPHKYQYMSVPPCPLFVKRHTTFLSLEISRVILDLKEASFDRKAVLIYDSQTENKAQLANVIRSIFEIPSCELGFVSSWTDKGLPAKSYNGNAWCIEIKESFIYSLWVWWQPGLLPIALPTSHRVHIIKKDARGVLFCFIWGTLG